LCERLGKVQLRGSVMLRFLFPLLLTACTTTQAPRDLSPQMQHAQGVFSYREQDKGFSAGYVWEQTPQETTVNLIAPFGAWRALLRVTPQQARLAFSNGKILTAKNPENLMRENLGWFIPVRDLQYWLWAKPVPHMPATVIRDHVQVIKIQQAGWQIHYTAYDKMRPSRMVLSQDDKVITVVLQ